MESLAEVPFLEFSSSFGTFSIRPVPSKFSLFALCLVDSSGGVRELGRYCGLNDAVLAVSRQESGFRPWDEARIRDLPFQVHDIACWTLSEYFFKKNGTDDMPYGSNAT